MFTATNTTTNSPKSSINPLAKPSSPPPTPTFPQHCADKASPKKLLQHLANYARENHLRIRPVCSYVQAEFKRSTEFQDIKEPD
ncbi:GNAT family N-acetyltransferase [Kingella negevensis]|uniref:GNAT family N-acetyltransferase n=1 Tax=Kingella negevensis TaxID=1522312 RepID=UPI000A69CD96|nr:N-acetyltransferase [Kingella negevensis]MDK4688767.1 N-acetyltransferase [Kingella negevensis]WII90108.1 N-acetyltransferase [Kingella negevensis]